MYEQATKNNWQDGGFRIRYSKEISGLPLLNNTCWHCSYCQSNISQIIQKLEARSHREYNTAKKRSRAWTLDRARRGVDLLGQTNKDVLTYLPNNTDVPEYVNQHRERFWNMLAIYGTPNAGFLDVDSADPLREDNV
jgi:hypothetical protein